MKDLGVYLMIAMFSIGFFCFSIFLPFFSYFLWEKYIIGAIIYLGIYIYLILFFIKVVINILRDNKKEEKNQKKKFVNSKDKGLDFKKPKPPLS